jgi:nifR3 family TIM-barrel protein
MWRRLDVKPGGERPMVFQIFGFDVPEIVRAAQRIEEWGADMIDINMGCAVPQVSEQGAGVGMMRRPQLVAEMFAQLAKHVRVPVTGKIRLGWDEASRNYLEIAKIMEGNGAALIAVHGRTKTQKYTGEADWDAIAEIKQAVNVPVIGNGDVKCVADIVRMKAWTGCDAVMIGRAAVGNPWIFAHQERDELVFADITAVIRLHLDEMLAYYGNPEGLILFRPHLRRYFSGLALKRFMLPLLETEDGDCFAELLRVVETAVPADQTIGALQQLTYFRKPQLA